MSQLGPLLSIDPGVSGGWALISVDGTATAGDLPVAGGHLDPATFSALIRASQPRAAILEAVASRPGQGVASVFKFGRAYGTIIGTLAALGIPTHTVAPTVWKKHHRIGPDKDAARALALRLWPAIGCLSRVKDHNRAEALLIGQFALDVLPGIGQR